MFFMRCVAARAWAGFGWTRSPRRGSRTALAVVLIACVLAPAALASECPGHPNAIGTSRTLVVDPKEHPRIGTMQYPQSLPLADHEVVLTFDDGPLPRHSNQILEILASQCVKATFFTIGRMAKASPEGVRKLRDAGHTIGTHTQNHPLSMNHMGIERAKQEIDEGIASVKAALGGDADQSVAPFFRIPGLLRASNVEDYLAEQGIQIWSADFLADDWRHISSSRVYDLAIKRLEAKGKGILLLHDIQPRTVAALPRILDQMKARGYRIVHVVPATADRPATPTEPQQWRRSPPPDDREIAHWPEVQSFVFAEASELPAPALADFDLLNAQPIASAKPDRSTAADAPWPKVTEVEPENAAIALPAPAQWLFEKPEGLRLVLNEAALPSNRTARSGQSAHASGVEQRSADANVSRRSVRDKVHPAKMHRAHASRRDPRRGKAVAGHAARPAATAHRNPQAKKRSV